jgi:phage terminase Nu1 subunit (DNA packaging protein)
MKLEQVDGQTLATVLGITPRRLQQLAQAGVIPRIARGKYDLPQAVQAHAAWLVSGRSSNDISAERRKLLNASARIRLVEAKRAEASVVPIADVDIVVSEMAAIVVRQLENIPGRLANECAMQPAGILRERAKAEIRLARQLMSDKLQEVYQERTATKKPRRPRR